jgi:lantibiotic transport system permease protein
MTFVRVLLAEQLKMKRTLALRLAPLIPLVIVVLQMCVLLQRQDVMRGIRDAQAWADYAGQTVLLWLLLMYVLFITLETTLLGNLEHGSQQWKHLFALPVARTSIYMAKQVSAMVIIAISLAALYVYILLSGLAFRWIAPGLGFEATPPWLTLAKDLALIYVASWLLISIHTWVGLRWPGFVLPVAAGIVAVVVSVIVVQSDYGGWFPWTMTVTVLNALREGTMPLSQLLGGALGGVAVCLLGCWDVTRRDVL